MKKLLATLVMALVAVMTINAQETLYLNINNQSWGTVNPSDNDQTFTYNAATQTYEATVDCTVSPRTYMRLYTKTGGTVTSYGSETAAFGTMYFTEAGQSVSKELIKGNSSPFSVGSFYGGLGSSKITLSVSSDFTTLSATQEAEVTFDKVYLWGSNEGGVNTKLFATLLPSADDPNVFTCQTTFPYWNLDPNSAMADFLVPYFQFNLSTSAEGAKKGLVFYANFGPDADTPQPENFEIRLKNGESFSTKMQNTLDLGSSLQCYTPGLVEVTLNVQTQMLTVTMLEAMNKSTFRFRFEEGSDLYGKISNFVNLTNAGVDVKIFDTPQEVFYFGDMNVTLRPDEGYAITVEGPAGDNYSISMSRGVATVKSSEPDLTYTVTIGLNTNPEPDDPEEDTYSVNLRFSGVSLGEIAEAVQVLDALGDGEFLTIDSNPYEYEFTAPGAMLVFNPGAAYGLNVKCTTNALEAVEGQYAITGIGAADLDDDQVGGQDMGKPVYLMLYPGADGLTFQITLSKTDGVAGVAAEDGDAVYFDLQGRKVANPERGIYVKVAAGKASKVVL